MDPEREVPSLPRATPLSIQMLGSFSVSIGDRVIDELAWELRKAKNLVKLLALDHGHKLHREQTMELLWPELDPEAGSNNLHKALHVARRVLEPDLAPKAPSAFLHSRGEFIVLESGSSLSIDVELFRDRAERARLSQDPSQYEGALALYVGDLLPGDPYEQWTMGIREQLKAQRLGLMLELAGLREQGGDISGAVDVLCRLVTLDPAHEDASARLMRLYARSGYRHLALRQYVSLKEALRQELDAQPGQTIQSLHQQILTGDLAGDVDLGALTVGSSPVRVGSSDLVLPIVGRETELGLLRSAVDSLVDGGGRLLLLRGEAGHGKTRLAAELIAYAAPKGVVTLWGSAVENEAQAPYAPFIQGLEGLALRVAPGGLRMLLGESAPELAGMVPMIGSMLGQDADQSVPQHDSWRLFATVSDCLTRLASHQPVLFVLDNLHASDEASLYLLDYLVTTLSTAPVLFLGALRPEDVPRDSAVAHVTAKLVDKGMAEWIDIGPLGRMETEQLVGRTLGGAVDPSVLEVIYAAALGNPYYAQEAVRALEGRDALRRRQERWGLKEGRSTEVSRDRLRRRTHSTAVGLAS